MDALIPNMVIKWNPLSDSECFYERILWLDCDNVVVINLKNNEFPSFRRIEEILLALDELRARLVTYITEAENFAEDQIPPRRLEDRNQAWKVIEAMISQEPDIYIPRYRGVLVRETMAKFQLTKPTVHEYLKLYWRAGKSVNGLLDRYDLSGGRGKPRSVNVQTKKRGRPRKITEKHPEQIGINVDENVLRIIRLCKEVYYEQQGLTFGQTYKQMLLKFFAKGIIVVDGKEEVDIDRSEIPLYKTFEYWMKKEIKVDPISSLEIREGERKFNKDIRPKTGSATQTARSPGGRYQIDATIVDVYLRSSYRRKLIIGKPVIYTVIDVFSHLIVGLYIGLEGPSYLGALMAILNTGMSKVDYCKKYGVTITEDEWPCHYLPSQFTADRGELLTKNNGGLINPLNIDIEHTAPYRADMKPIVESYFHVLNKGVIHRLPGKVSLQTIARGEKDYRLDAKLTLQEFTQLIIIKVLQHNKNKYMSHYQLDEDMIRDGIQPIPRDLWNWGIRKRGGSLRYYTEDILKVNLLPNHKARITDRGIVFKGIPYTCQRAEQEGWFLHVKNKFYDNSEVQVAFDPRFTEKIFLKLNNGLNFEECTMINREHHALQKNWDEFDHIQEIIALEHEEHKQQEMQSDVSLEYHLDKIIAQAELLTEETTMSDKQQLDGIRENKAFDKEENRKTEHAFADTDISPVVESSQADTVSAVHVSVTEKVPKPQVKGNKAGSANQRMKALNDAQTKRRKSKEA